MASPAGNSSAPAVPALQQGMSPSNVMIEGEVRGPDYNQQALDPLRVPQQEYGTQDAMPTCNGVTPASVDDGALGVTIPQLASGVTAAMVTQDEQLRQLPMMGTVAAPAGSAEAGTGSVPRRNVFTGTARDEQGAADTRLFPQFMPSPLPGQSPVASRGATTTRAATWLSRLGDYLQKTVEVTSWTAHGSPGLPGPWQGRESQTPTARPSLPAASLMISSGEDRPPSSSGSAGISPELVQAEVAKQVQMAMGDLHEQLRQERERMAVESKQQAASSLPPPPGLQKGHDRDVMKDLEVKTLCEDQGNVSDGTSENNLLTSMARGIEALLRQQEQMGPRADRPETVKPGITDLPRLPEYQPMTGSIDLLNWLTHIQPIMEDLSDTSAAWWEGTLQDASRWYSSYSAASPLERLRRATAMMLSAVPAQVREEAIAMGNVGSLTLLCKLYAVYQPGGGVVEEVDIVEEKGLDRITMKVVKANSELSFRDLAQEHLVFGPSLQRSPQAMQAVERLSKGPSGAAQRKVNFEDDGVIQSKVLQVLAEVQLAGDSMAAMKQTEAGSLLTGDQLAQVIVPLGKVITNLGYELCWTANACELLGPGGDVLPLTVKNGCPEVSEEVAQSLICQLEEKQLLELEDVTQSSLRAIAKLKSSWWSHLKEYVAAGDVQEAHQALDKASFFDYKEVVKECMVTRIPRASIWDLMKELRVNRRARKRLLRASSWVLRWDSPAVEKVKDPMKHLMFYGDRVYVNMNTLLAENEFHDVWRVIQWAAINGRIGMLVSKDAMAKPLDQVVALPHRCKVHFLHALASAAREVHGGEAVRFFVEDWERVQRVWRGNDDPLASTWPPWTMCKHSRAYFDEMGLSDVSIGDSAVVCALRAARLSSDAAWRLHVAQNHQPFRRDCAVCVRNSAAGHQHRTTAHPMAYTLSVDVVGPLKGWGKSPDGKFFKYFVIGAMRIPRIGGKESPGDVRGHPIPPPEPEGEDQLSDDEPEDHGEVADGGGVDPSELEREDKQWKELMTSFKEPILTSTLYFAVPVNNKKAATMLPAVQRMVVDVKALGYPVTRIHSDRGGEFRGNLVRKWALSQGMWPTTTSGSDSAANGVAESGVRYLKRRARILLDTAGVSKDNWPTAIQYAAAQQRSEQLGSLPMMPVAYGTRVYVKTKRYKTGAVEDFGHHWTRGRYVGPSTDIRGGHVVLKDSGTFIQTTHVRITRDPPSLDEVAPAVIVEPEDKDVSCDTDPPLPPPPLPPPPRRVSFKAPAVHKLDAGYSQDEVLRDVPSDENVFEEEQQCLKYLRIGEIQYVEAIAEQMCNKSEYTDENCARLLALFAGTCGNLKVPRAPEGKGLIVGAYVHGGAFELTRYARDLPWVARYFNDFLLRKLKETRPQMTPSWTTLAIQMAEEVPKHRDSHNERGTYNYVMELKTGSSEGLWVQNRDDAQQVIGGTNPQDFRYEDLDGRSYEGALVDVTTSPAVFDPLIPHAYVKGNAAKWFLSAYTPQGAYKLGSRDLKYLKAIGFPLAQNDHVQDGPTGALETTPVLKAASLPSDLLLSGARSEDDEVEVVTVGDCEATLWNWAMYMEAPLEEEVGDGFPTGGINVRKVCASDDPGVELGGLTTAPGLLGEEEIETRDHVDMVQNVEYWSSVGLYDCPRIAKLEPEYVEGIEDIIKNAVESDVPLRHTYNVSPQEAKAVIQKWQPAIAKELGVVERGFKRVSVKDVVSLKQSCTVQELPSKLVYTVKPPSGEQGLGGEPMYCRRKARIVCCGNYAAADQEELYAGGAAAESLRCALTFTAKRRWRSGILDITGAFMLTPLPVGRGQVIYLIRPPTALVQLGLAEPDERWMLTHGMYGLRQSPKLWSSFRDQEMKKMVVEYEGKTWTLTQGTAEPNMWLLYPEGGSTTQEPDGLVLVYVDDILICGPDWLVQATATTVRGVWKASELEMLDVDHEIRFLGCEIAVTEGYDGIYIHQRPYIEEVLRHHSTPHTELSPIQAPKEMVSFEAREGEEPGTDEQVKQAQRACGELLWIAQRSRPDISFVVCAMGSLLTRAAPRCLAIASRLRSYLQRTKTLALSLRPTNEDFAIYTDSSFAPEGSKSHSGLVAVWLGAPVCWRSARQPFTCLSTAECELLAATEGLVMARSVESVLYQMKKDVGKIYLQVDNQAAVSLCKPSASSSWRTRHLRVRASYIHEQVENDQVVVSFVPGKNQWADLLTKSFPRQRLEELIGIWGFVDMTAGFSKVAMVRALIACMMVQTARAQEEEEPLALTMSLELYLMIAVFMIAAVAIWEFLWWCVDRADDTKGNNIDYHAVSVTYQRGNLKPPHPRKVATSNLTTCFCFFLYYICKTVFYYNNEVQDREVPVPVPDPSAWTYPLYVMCPFSADTGKEEC
ncbi:unnamed protein product [Symbiodinium sp. KB8]|nr:unnamed protein product [Symbiodinium sp. KB8]